MLRNWTLKVKQVKNKEKGLFTLGAYLLNNKDKSHRNTTIHEIKNVAVGTARILQEYENRAHKRRIAKLRGGGVSNLAQSYVLSLPPDIKQPTPEEWEIITKRVIGGISKAAGINPNDLWKVSAAVVHEESNGKPSHVHLITGNCVKGEYLKVLTQKSVLGAAKKAFNGAVLEVLGVSNKTYRPERENVGNVPLWKARAEIEQGKAELELKKKDFEEQKHNLTQFLKSNLSNKLFRQYMMLKEYMENNNAPRIKSTNKRIEKTQTEIKATLPTLDTSAFHVIKKEVFESGITAKELSKLTPEELQEKINKPKSKNKFKP